MRDETLVENLCQTLKMILGVEDATFGVLHRCSGVVWDSCPLV